MHIWFASHLLPSNAVVECKTNMAKSSRETARGNVFLSWSGERSLHVAKFFHGWLQKVVQRAKPWLSDVDIDKGTVGLDEIKKALAGMKIGVFFLTPENRDSLWIPYEAGSLASELDDKSRVCTYFLGDLQLQHVKGPLGMFQRTKADKEDTRKMVHSINKAMDAPVPDTQLDEIFAKWWPDLESCIQEMPKTEEMVKPLPTTDQMLAEILELSRAASNRGKQSEWLDQLTADNRDFFPALFQLLKGVNLDQLLVVSTPQVPPPPPVAPQSVFCIKLVGDSEIKRVEGTVAAVTAVGQVVIFIGNEPVARFESVEGWWRETPRVITQDEVS